MQSVICVCRLALVLVLPAEALFWSTSSGSALGGASPAFPVLVPLHRQTVPLGLDGWTVNTYFGKISLGTPKPKEFTVVFDTGSGHVVVPSSRCLSSSCQSRLRYDTSLSSSATLINADGGIVNANESRDQITVQFGTGAITGEFVREHVCMGSASLHPGLAQSCADMHLVSALEMSNEPFDVLAFDGIFGLGLDPLAISPDFNFLGKLGVEGNGVAPQVSIFLADDIFGDGEEQSELALGGKNDARLSSPITWVPVISPEAGHWQIEIRGVRIGANYLDICKVGRNTSATSCRGVLDTGTSGLGVPTMFDDAIKQAIVGEASRDTAGAMQCPDLHIDLDGLTLSLGPWEYARHMMPTGSMVISTDTSLLEGVSPSSCTEGLMELGEHPVLGPRFFLLGEPVLRRYYTVFDPRGPRIGFGLAHHRREQQSAVELYSDTSPRERRVGGLLRRVRHGASVGTTG